jgi:anti-anti-sigma regulatory factor
MMLRIYIHDEVPVTSFVLEGKLIGPWVKELEKYWQSAVAVNPSRAMLVDLADVTFVDSDGRGLLARMRRKGVRFLSTGVLINAIVAEIDAQEHKNGQGRITTKTEKGPQAFAERTARTRRVLSDD